MKRILCNIFYVFFCIFFLSFRRQLGYGMVEGKETNYFPLFDEIIATFVNRRTIGVPKKKIVLIFIGQLNPITRHHG